MQLARLVIQVCLAIAAARTLASLCMHILKRVLLQPFKDQVAGVHVNDRERSWLSCL